MRPQLLPFLPNRVWRTYQGGAVLDRLEDKPLPADSHFPEDWVGSATVAVNPEKRPADEGLTRVDVPGQPIFRDLLAKDPEQLLGPAHSARFGADPHYLVKLLDSAVRLHFQAHPTAEFAQTHGLGPSGKAEAYHILEIRPEIKDPYILIGFQHPPSRADLKAMIEAQDLAAIEACFERIPVSVGETYYIPGGRPHAIGPGILMVEVMEPSDLVVRFEFEKGGYVLPESARFMGRGLDFCLDLFNYEAISTAQVREQYGCPPVHRRQWPGEGEQFSLLEKDRNPRFTLRKSIYQGTSTWEGPDPFIGIVTQGKGVLRSSSGDELTVAPYSRFFVPAALRSFEVEPIGGPLEILECYPPAT